MDKKLRHVRVGDPITDTVWNEVTAKLNRSKLNVASCGMLGMTEHPQGRTLSLRIQKPVPARLSGSSSPYSWTALIESSGGGYDDRVAGLTGGSENAYEANGKDGLDGKVVLLDWTAARDWRFQWVGYGPCQVAEICVIVTGGCDGNPVAADVTVTQGETLIGTCVTVGEVGSLSLSNQGSGYTNGTGYSLGFSGGGGSGATGTFDVVAGKITNPVLTNGGTGYTGVPTITFPGAGSGVNGSVIAGMQARCCVALPDVGTYNLEVASDGFNTVTQEVVAACTTNTETIALVKTSGGCCSGCPSIPTGTSPVVTDANATIALTYNAGTQEWVGCYTFTSDQVLAREPPTPNVPEYCTVFTGCDWVRYVSGSVGVVYRLKCVSGTWQLTQSWLPCNCTPEPLCDGHPNPSPTFRGFQLSGANSDCTLQALPGAMCGPLGTSSHQLAASEIVCNPLQITFDFPAASGGFPLPSGGPAVVTLP